MSEVLPWCVIFNRNTVNRREHDKWKFFLTSHQIDHESHDTFSVTELHGILQKKISSGYKHFLFAGGDGTLHHGGNQIINIAEENSKNIIIGVLPSGTGNDWFRTFGISGLNLAKALKERTSVPQNLLQIKFADGRIHYALNMVGAALDAAVVDTLNKSKFKIPGVLKYTIALLQTLAKPHRWNGVITIDGKIADGDWLTIQAGFGKYCGGGMIVLPHADEDKAALLLMKPKNIVRLITSLPKIYNGKIANQPEAVTAFFEKLEIHHTDIPIPVEADGEWLGISPVTIKSVSLFQRVQ